MRVLVLLTESDLENLKGRRSDQARSELGDPGPVIEVRVELVADDTESQLRSDTWS
jgi:hypothetical protein